MSQVDGIGKPPVTPEPGSDAPAGAPAVEPPPLPVRELLAKVPFKLGIFFIVLSLVVGEWFPISQYPMYANPGKTHWYVYVTDTDDRPIPSKTVFGIATSFLKKIYRNRGRKLGDERAAQEALAYLYREASNPKTGKPSALRLWRMDLQIKGKQILHKKKLLGEYTRP